MLSQPSVIARLMGMEPQPTSFPATMITRDCSEEEEEAMELLRSARATPPGEASVKLIAAELKQSKCNPLLSSHSSRRRAGEGYYRRCLDRMKRPLRRDGSRWSSSTSSSLRRLSYNGSRHRHPQEELLGKIREDFQAWLQRQSSSSQAPPPADGHGASAVVVGSRGAVKAAGCLDGRYVQVIAQANLRREKVLARCAGSGHGGGGGRSECKVEEEETTKNAPEGLAAAAMVVAECEEFSRAASWAAVDGEHEQLPGAPTRIAILRPATGGGDRRGPAVSTPLTWKKVGTMDDLGGGGTEEFLRELRERLRSEMAARSSVAGTGRRSEPKVGPAGRDTASSMAAAAQSRAAVPSKGDNGGKLLGRRKMMSRSESFRVFRGDRKVAAAAAAGRPASPERGTTTSASPPPPPPTNATSRGGRRGRSPAPADAASPAAGVDARRSPTTTLPQEAGSDVAVSPRALLRRSFSSPATGFASLPRRHGAPDDTSSEAGPELTSSSSSRRSRSFSLVRGTAASLRQSFSVGGKLKQLLLLHLSNSKKKPSSSSSPCPVDDLAGLAPRSPVSPLEVEGHSRRRHFSLSGEIISCSSFPELSPKCSSEFDAPVAGGPPLEPKASDGGSESEGDPDKAYVREVLVAAGLWHVDGGGSVEDTASSSSKAAEASMVVPISDDVFDEVEDAYYCRRCRHGEEECAVVDAGDEEEEEERGHGAAAARRRMLFDLANEALMQRQQCGGGNGERSSLRGKELEHEVWRRVAVEEKDDPAAAAEREVLGCSAWPEAAAAWEEEARGVGSKVERAIFDDLVGQVVRQQLASCVSLSSTRSNLASFPCSN